MPAVNPAIPPPMIMTLFRPDIAQNYGSPKSDVNFID